MNVVDNMGKPKGECDAVELISKAAKISPERADEFITITQFMPLDKMMEEQAMAEIKEILEKLSNLGPKKIILTGDYACFTRPEMKVERVSYDVPTPGAIEGILKSVYWKPAIRYVIDKIIVYNPINFIIKYRQILEDDQCEIGSWIDLIFGSKAKGKEAEKEVQSGGHR